MQMNTSITVYNFRCFDFNVGSILNVNNFYFDTYWEMQLI